MLLLYPMEQSVSRKVSPPPGKIMYQTLMSTQWTQVSGPTPSVGRSNM